MKVVFHPAFHAVYTSDPAAAAGRMEAALAGLGPEVEWVEPEAAGQEDLLRAHSAAHIESIRRLGLYEIAALAAGGAIRAAEIGMSEPCFAAIRPPGHHASRDSCWGFCFFNNMAVAVLALAARGLARRVHILDFDLHYGDGTENILGSRPGVSIHNPAAAGRGSYLEEIERTLARAEADVIGVSAGFDNHLEDWGGLLLTEDYRAIGGMVREAAGRLGAGCFALLEGGYNHAVLGENVRAFLAGLSGEEERVRRE
ncbi:MAG: histone deacetylase family protein [Desulfobacterales bacterium]